MRFCCGKPSVAFRSAKVAVKSRYFRGAKGDDLAKATFPQQKPMRFVLGFAGSSISDHKSDDEPRYSQGQHYLLQVRNWQTDRICPTICVTMANATPATAATIPVHRRLNIPHGMFPLKANGLHGGRRRRFPKGTLPPCVVGRHLSMFTFSLP